ncbi:hypothetical protein TcBrA4_0060250 [Trypanosoma cruzi]|nr:hypothetical protein TcBrA4_0060250 [Trypanosoma cruzi]
MNASRNILPRKCSWPCRQSRVSPTFQQLLFGEASLSFVLVSRAPSSYKMENAFHNWRHQAPPNNEKDSQPREEAPKVAVNVSQTMRVAFRSRVHCNSPQPPTVSSFLVDPNRMVHLDLLGSPTDSRNGVPHSRAARDSITSPSTSAAPNSVEYGSKTPHPQGKRTCIAPTGATERNHTTAHYLSLSHQRFAVNNNNNNGIEEQPRDNP